MVIITAGLGFDTYSINGALFALQLNNSCSKNILEVHNSIHTEKKNLDQNPKKFAVG